MRIQIPIDYSEDNVAVTANALFVHFANDLASFINDFMTSRKGIAWLQDLQVEDATYRNFNPKDPAALLKDLTRNGSSKFRPALASRIERGFMKDYLDDLDVLLGERNAWLHRQVQETKSELLDLITSLLRVGTPLRLKIIEDCKVLQASILNINQAAPTVAEVNPQGETVPTTDVLPIIDNEPKDANLEQSVVEVLEIDTFEEKINQSQVDHASATVMEQGEPRLGDVVNEQLLSHSYVLHVNGEIRDRASEELLSNVNPNSAGKLGALLIARKPSGGRIRITEEGILCAFFGEKWGYLAKVKAIDWFHNHLQASTEEE